MVSFPPRNLNVQNPQVPKILSGCCRQNAVLIVEVHRNLRFLARVLFRHLPLEIHLWH